MASKNRERLSRDRVIELVDLVLEANEVLGYGKTIGLEISKFNEELNVYQVGGEISYFVYTTTGKSYTNNSVRAIHDPDLKKGEEHVRKLLAAKEEEKNDTV